MKNEKLVTISSHTLNKLYIKRKEVTWNDVPFYQYMILWAHSGFVWLGIQLVIDLASK